MEMKSTHYISEAWLSQDFHQNVSYLVKTPNILQHFGGNSEEDLNVFSFFHFHFN